MVLRKRRVLALAVALGSILSSGCAGSPTATPYLQSVVVSISSGSNVLIPGQTLQLNATATFSDDARQDITNNAQWTASNEEVASVSLSGLVTAKRAGSSTIRARYGLFQGEMSIHVR